MTGKMLVIAEKPSVAKTLAKALGAYQNGEGYLEGSGCIVSWCYGHLAEYAAPDAYDEKYKKWRLEDLPIVPGHWKLNVSKDKAKQFKVLKKLLHRQDMGLCVNSCDAGREGELIFWNVYEMAGSTLPVKRLWISSLEEASIKNGFNSLKEAAYYQGTHEAATCRARADWLVGINATRGFTTKYGTKLLVGRVQSPTLALIASRQKEIDDFVKEEYFKVTVKGSGIAAVSRELSEEKADSLVKACESSPATIQSVTKERKRTNPPKLYDLTAIQRDANRFFGYTAKQTLDALQELYEKKLVTYPRTYSRFITSDMGKSVEELLVSLEKCFSFMAKGGIKNIDRLVCDSKVTDHHAIIPTRKSVSADYDRLSEREQNLYLMIAARLAAAACGPKAFDVTMVKVVCAGEAFTANGRSVIEEGFAQVEDAFRAGYVKRKLDKDKPLEELDISVVNILDDLLEGMKLLDHKAEKSKHYTNPPKPYTEDTLLEAMEKAGRSEMEEDVERKGIGTPATRAATIEKLVSAGYIQRKGKKLLPTAEGIILCDLLPDKMKSASLTAAWENRLLGIERGTTDAGSFMEDIIEDVNDLVRELAERTDKVEFPNGNHSKNYEKKRKKD